MKKYNEIEVTEILANPYQPRNVFEKDGLNELAQSIRENGILQPIVVRPTANGKYEIVAGERRFRAAVMTGLNRVPCIIENYTDEQSARLAIIENVQRENLSPIEEAEAYDKLLKMNNQTQAELALEVGKTQSTIANKLRLLKLPEVTKEALRERQITERHARALLSLENTRKVEKLTQRIIDEHLTVARTEDIVKKGGFIKEKGEKKKRVLVITKNVRIALNTIKQAVTMIQKTGVGVVMEERDETEEYIVTLKIKK